MRNRSFWTVLAALMFVVSWAGSVKAADQELPRAARSQHSHLHRHYVRVGICGCWDPSRPYFKYDYAPGSLRASAFDWF